MCSRVDKALSQPMYLMSALRTGDSDWNFLVQGSSGTNYYLHFSDQRFVCECPDFVKRRDLCKHVYFIIGRVLGDVELMTDVELGLTASELFQSEYGFTRRLEDRLRRCLDSDVGNAAGGEGDCAICFESLCEKPVWTCDGCKQSVLHSGCAERWLKMNHSCPLCRASHKKAKDAFDALANFTTFYTF